MTKERVAAITGAGQGNGRAMAFGLAAAGWAVAVIDIDRAAAEQTAADLRAAGHRAEAWICDIADADACTGTARAIEARLGDITALVNNAGVVRRGRIDDDRLLADLDTTLAINVKGIVHVTRAFLAQLRRTKGSIVNVASIASYIATPNNVAYNASKGAVKQITQSLALDLAPEGIRVNAIAPGFMETRMTQDTRADAQKLAYFLRRVPMGRAGQPEELAGAVVFLVSEAAGYVTGAMLPVDGGFLAG